MTASTITPMRNPVLSRLLETQQMQAPDNTTVSLRHPEFPDSPSNIDRACGELLQRIIRELRPARTLEVGLAYGISTLFICEALAQASPGATHTVIDPFQNGKWRGLGLRNLTQAGYRQLVEFREAPSEVVLPQLLADGRTLDFAFIDGLHRFDQVMVEFYYINRLLEPGGVVVFDDANRRSVTRALRHAMTYPCYELHPASRTAQPVSPIGRMRRRVASLSFARRILRHDVLVPDWDLGLGARCIALRKTGADVRHTYFDAEF
jgi:predicted O-methyltransferase YrrM